ncbi:MAG TPA: 3-dehydroquinate synthase [Methylomirabilota bacterium]|nr:3-dehydroquinate synthase [Methylomirabilota bacterium]
MNTLRVNLGERSYDIHIAGGDTATVGPFARQRCQGSAAFVVTDENVRAHGDAVAQALAAAGFHVATAVLPPGEAQKALSTASALYDRLADVQADRRTLVVAVGGGVVGDLAGFVAATFNRGLPFLQVPTTLLAMVDSSVGGKVGVNHPKAKNLIGAFHQPRLVICDPATTRTLPPREFRSGLAEIVKHGIVLDADYFAEVERDAAALGARDLPTVERIVGGSCRLKASIVERDERESELRHVLNYGHTIGHALEAATGYARFAHGEAVSLGIVAEARLALRLGLASADTVTRQERLLAAVGLPVRAPALDAEAVVAAIARDKKARDGRVPFVLAPRIGAFRLVYDVPAADVRAVLAALGT